MRITREPLKKIPVLRESDLIVLVCGLVFGGGGDSYVQPRMGFTDVI